LHPQPLKEICDLVGARPALAKSPQGARKGIRLWGIAPALVLPSPPHTVVILCDIRQEEEGRERAHQRRLLIERKLSNQTLQALPCMRRLGWSLILLQPQVPRELPNVLEPTEEPVSHLPAQSLAQQLAEHVDIGSQWRFGGAPAVFGRSRRRDRAAHAASAG
jgi:hypothetical protein